MKVDAGSMGNGNECKLSLYFLLAVMGSKKQQSSRADEWASVLDVCFSCRQCKTQSSCHSIQLSSMGASCGELFGAGRKRLLSSKLNAILKNSEKVCAKDH